MISPIARTNLKSDRINPLTPPEQCICSHCGGNGYTKSAPSCYQTCLNCLGRGLIPKDQ